MTTYLPKRGEVFQAFNKKSGRPYTQGQGLVVIFWCSRQIICKEYIVIYAKHFIPSSADEQKRASVIFGLRDTVWLFEPINRIFDGVGIAQERRSPVVATNST